MKSEECQFIDVHTHNSKSVDGVLAIRSLHSGYSDRDGQQWASAGLHPWYLQDWESNFEGLKRCVTDYNIVGIGECGLDKKCIAPFAEQLKAFNLQILLANQTGKPLIIHCVAAFSELQACLQQLQSTVPVIIHGYNKKPTIAAELLKAGYYISFGKAILWEGSQAATVLAAMPDDRFFLETDDSGLDIRLLYARAAAIRKTDEETIILQVRKNFKTVFFS